ncbi:MAG: hypothetical protein Q9P01_00225 [Anaerolineae bacterium]|nr:hypothetical protein [Anaerolineae bacterium]
MGFILVARSAQNRVLLSAALKMPMPINMAGGVLWHRKTSGESRKTKWRKLKLDVLRGKTRRLQYHIMGPVLRRKVCLNAYSS